MRATFFRFLVGPVIAVYIILYYPNFLSNLIADLMTRRVFLGATLSCIWETAARELDSSQTYPAVKRAFFRGERVVVVFSGLAMVSLLWPELTTGHWIQNVVWQGGIIAGVLYTWGFLWAENTVDEEKAKTT